MLDKVLYGVAGAAGAGVVAWRTLFPWIKYDLSVMKVGKHLKNEMEKDVASGLFLIDKFEEHVVNQPKKAFLIFDENVFTYEYIDQQANRVANIVRTWGLKADDTVAIMIYNEPAFVWTFLGLQKLGISAAFINFNLRQKQLSHSVKVSESKAFIVGAGKELYHAILEEGDEFASLPIYFQGCSADEISGSMYHTFDDLMLSSPPTGIDPSIRSNITAQSTGCYIYTSGTTGLPKPVVISQRKLIGYTVALKVVYLNNTDILYTVLPLYHSAGGAVGLGTTISVGATMVLRKKFSATHFWEDCARYKVTVIQYIGELFRYLIAQPKSPYEKQHIIRAAFGNGLRKDIWEEVQSRFNIPLIAEFFGATEGTTMLFNISNKPGAIGRISPIIKRLLPNPIALVKYDYATAEPIRDANGRCIEINPGEKGLFISGIPEEIIQAGVQFYKSSKEANEKKIIRNAFTEGDMFFNYGDLFYLDKEYFVYFVDRIGDTFRWKGENVSTTEVANIISSLDFIHDANVYGVSIPGHDGRAGMAALTMYSDKSLTLDHLKRIWKHCHDNLASYARPLFLRLQKEATLTATFKQRKVELVKDGYDLKIISDPLYYSDVKNQTFVPVTDDLSMFMKSRL